MRKHKRRGDEKWKIGAKSEKPPTGLLHRGKGIGKERHQDGELSHTRTLVTNVKTQESFTTNVGDQCTLIQSFVDIPCPYVAPLKRRKHNSLIPS